MSCTRALASMPLAPSTRSKLQQAGFETQQEVLELPPLALARELQVTPDEANAILSAVRNAQNHPAAGDAPAAGAAGCVPPSPLMAQGSDALGQSALELLRQRRSREAIYTLCAELDEMLGGGVPRGEVTEFFGVPGMGKTQLGMQLACDVQIPRVFGGAGGEAVYVDTEGSLMPERLQEVAQELIGYLLQVAKHKPSEGRLQAAEAMTSDDLLSRIHCFRVFDSGEQLACIRNMAAFLADHPRVRLLVIDSVSFHFRRGFADMSLRSRLLMSMAQDLLALAHRFDLAVVLTNQVTTKVDADQGSLSRLVPALGDGWSAACTNRVKLHWVGQDRVATLVKSSSQGASSATYLITGAGIRGVARAR